MNSATNREFGQALLRGVPCILIPWVLAIFLPPSLGSLVLLLSPFFAGLLAGLRGSRPIWQGALACALAVALVFAVIGLFAEKPMLFGRDTFAFGMVLVYSMSVGALGAKLSSRTPPNP